MVFNRYQITSTRVLGFSNHLAWLAVTTGHWAVHAEFGCPQRSMGWTVTFATNRVQNLFCRSDTPSIAQVRTCLQEQRGDLCKAAACIRQTHSTTAAQNAPTSPIKRRNRDSEIAADRWEGTNWITSERLDSIIRASQRSSPSNQGKLEHGVFLSSSPANPARISLPGPHVCSLRNQWLLTSTIFNQHNNQPAQYSTSTIFN